MFNIPVAIVLDSYDEVKKEVGPSSKTIIEQIFEMTYRTWRKLMRHRIDMEIVWHALVDEYGKDVFGDNNEELSLEELMTVCKELPPNQAMRLFRRIQITCEETASDASQLELLDAAGRLLESAKSIGNVAKGLPDAVKPQLGPPAMTRISEEEEPQGTRSDMLRVKEPLRVKLPSDMAGFPCVKHLDPGDVPDLASLQALLAHAACLADREQAPRVQQALEVALAVLTGEEVTKSV